MVHRRVAVFVAPGTSPAIAAKAATTTTPIVFLVREDPVRLGLVASLSRPGANLTGVNLFVGELISKRLELLRELVPGSARVAVLVNSANAALRQTTVRDAEAAARPLGLQIQVLDASTSREIDAAFATCARAARRRVREPGPFYIVRRVQLPPGDPPPVPLGIYAPRDPADVGGLMSYGTNIDGCLSSDRRLCGRVLKGTKPADLPVVQSSKFELVINAETARMLGLTVPSSLISAPTR